MQTTLPDLPFSHAGFYVGQTTSAVKSTPRKHPRTNLRELRLWNTFEQDIHEIILKAMADANLPLGTPLTVGVSEAEQVEVENEEDIREYANTKLHRAAQGVLLNLGHQGRFKRSGAGNNEMVGDPDFGWVRIGTKHPTVVVRTVQKCDLGRYVDKYLF